MPAHAILVLLATGVSNAFFFDIYSPAPRSAYELWYDAYLTREQTLNREPSSYWASSSEAYQMKIKLPDLEPHSVSASMASDGKSILVSGERKIEGCSCHPTTVKEIPLPYRPRAEDVDVAVKDGVLSIKLARQAKADMPTKLKVRVDESPVSTSSPTETSAPETPATRPLRFVPHESARAGENKSLEEKERSLTDKFRSAALASLASTRSPEAGNADTAAKGETSVKTAGVDTSSTSSSTNSNQPQQGAGQNESSPP